MKKHSIYCIAVPTYLLNTHNTSLEIQFQVDNHIMSIWSNLYRNEIRLFGMSLCNMNYVDRTEKEKKRGGVKKYCPLYQLMSKQSDLIENPT